jgi:hypothetical protein
VTWTRQPLAQLAAGRDAVVEITDAVINQVLRRQATIALPSAKAGPYGVASVAGSGGAVGNGSLVATGTIAMGVAQRSVVLNVVPMGQGPLRFVAASADLAGADVRLRLTVANDTGRAVMLAASLTLGAMQRPVPPPSVIAAGANGTILVPVANPPGGNHPINIRLFDLNDPAVVTVLTGTLELVSGSGSGGLVMTRTDVRTATILPHVPGLESRITRAITIEASPGLFSVDLNASAATAVILSCPLAITIETTQAESLVASAPFFAFDERGRSVNAAFDTQYSVTRRAAQGTLRVEAPLVTSVEPATQVVRASCDLQAAVVTVSAANPDLQKGIPELQRQFQAALALHVAIRGTGGRVDLTPRLSLVGTLRPGETINEFSFQQVTARVLPAASTNLKAVLAVAMSLSGNAGTPGVPENFIAADDYGTVVSEAVVQAIARFRWRVGDHPRILAGLPTETEYDEGGTRVPILVFPQMHQKSLMDGTSLVVSIKQAGPVTYGTSTGVFTFLMTDATATTKPHAEDFVLLGGRGDFEIAAVLRKDTMQPAPEAVSKNFQVPAELKDVLFAWPFSMSTVGPPAPAVDANVEAFLQAARAGVTQHVSRPFAEAHMVVLSRRHANGVDDYVLSGGTLTL